MPEHAEPVDPRADAGSDLELDVAFADPEEGSVDDAAHEPATVIARSGRSRNGGRYAGRFEKGSTSGWSSMPRASAMNARRASIRAQASG